jgi:hypothetical protein
MAMGKDDGEERAAIGESDRAFLQTHIAKDLGVTALVPLTCARGQNAESKGLSPAASWS